MTTLTEWHPGLAMRTAREQMGLDQVEFAQRLADTDPDGKWTQQKVSNLERRHTIFRDPEIKLVAAIQGKPYAWYFDGPDDAYRQLREAGLAQTVPFPRKRASRPMRFVANAA